MPTVSEYIQYRWLPRTARGIDVVSRKIIPVVADALATFGVSSVVAAKAIGEQGRTGLSNRNRDLEALCSLHVKYVLTYCPSSPA